MKVLMLTGRHITPDLNPVEHLWDIMYWCIQFHQVTPQTVQELTDALMQVWEKMPQDTMCRPRWSYTFLKFTQLG